MLWWFECKWPHIIIGLTLVWTVLLEHVCHLEWALWLQKVMPLSVTHSLFLLPEDLVLEPPTNFLAPFLPECHYASYHDNKGLNLWTVKAAQLSVSIERVAMVMVSLGIKTPIKTNDKLFNHGYRPDIQSRKKSL